MQLGHLGTGRWSRSVRAAAAGVLVVAGMSAATVLPGAVLAPAAAVTPSDVVDVSPADVTPTSSIKYGGRVETVSINPVNTQIALAASELGGLWRTNDGGGSWSHVDALPLTRMYDVKFAAGDPNLVVATGDNDGASPSRGGIWLSTDGGATWSRPPSAQDPTDCGLTAPGAHFADIAGSTPGQLSIFAATDCGISVSTDSGATWTHHFASGPSNATYWDVKTAVVGNVVRGYACGFGGFTYSADGGANWSAFKLDASGLVGGAGKGVAPCRVAIAPRDPNTVFLSSFKAEPNPNPSPNECSSILQMATNATSSAPTWTDLNACPNGDRNGRWPYVEAHSDPTNPTTAFQVYFGDNTRTYIQTCSYSPTACAAGPWSTYDGSSPHNGTDPTWVEFDPTTPNGCPVYAAGDGGVSEPSDCSTSPGSFTFVNNGLNALDALSMAGTVYPNHTDVYFGTQDNGFFDSQDGGGTWNRRDWDIYSVLADQTATSNSPASQVLWRNGAYNPPPTNHVNISNEDISSTAGFPLPPGVNPGDNYSATQFGYNSYAFLTPDVQPTATVTANWTMYVTTNGGGSWTAMGPTAPGTPLGNPQASGPASHPTFNVLLNVGGNAKLYRLAGPMSTSAVWTNVTSNLSNPTVFGVNPANPLLLYANDAGANRVMHSTNGGSSWVSDNALTALVQRGGQFPFANGGSQVAAFGFDPNSSTVMAGTNNAGVFGSTDGGADWFSVRGAENLPRIAGFFFDQRTHSVFFSSGGRGAWKLALPDADLSITKSASPEPVVAGQQLTYTLTVTNDGASPSTASSLAVTDTLPSQVTYLTSSNSTCVEGPTGTLKCGIPNLAPGASYTFTITTLVDPSTVVGTGGATTITNTATVSSADNVDTNLANNTATATSTVVDSADLGVTKVCKPDTTIYAGTPIVCTVFVDNHGPSDARNVKIDDVTKSNGAFTISNIAVSPGPTVCPVTSVTGGQEILCSVGNLAAASSTVTGRVTLTYTVTANDGQNIDNVATVRSDTPDPNAANNSATVSLTVTSLADLALAKQGPATVTAGTPITWTMSVTNNGPSTASNVVINDAVPAGVTITSATMSGGSCTAGTPGDPTRPTRCTFGSLAPGATSSTMSVTATVDPSTTGILVNDARVSSATFDNNSSNDLSSVSTTVEVHPDVSVAISATPDPVTSGTALSYQITTSNAGPSTATGIVLTDVLPSSLLFTATGGVGSCGLAVNTNTVTCSLPNLAPGTSETTFVYVTVKSSVLPGPIVNAVDVTSAGSDPVPGNNHASVSTTAQTRADLGIVLTSDLLVYKPSTTIHYQVTVTNTGPSDAQLVVVTMTLPPAKSGKYVSNNVGCAPPVGQTFTCGLGTIVTGGTSTFQLNFYIQGNKGTITSSASVTSTTIDPNPANNTSTRVVTVK